MSEADRNALRGPRTHGVPVEIVRPKAGQGLGMLWWWANAVAVPMATKRAAKMPVRAVRMRCSFMLLLLSGV